MKSLSAAKSVTLVFLAMILAMIILMVYSAELTLSATTIGSGMSAINLADGQYLKLGSKNTYDITAESYRPFSLTLGSQVVAAKEYGLEDPRRPLVWEHQQYFRLEIKEVANPVVFVRSLSGVISLIHNPDGAKLELHNSSERIRNVFFRTGVMVIVGVMVVCFGVLLILKLKSW